MSSPASTVGTGKKSSEIAQVRDSGKSLESQKSSGVDVCSGAAATSGTGDAAGSETASVSGGVTRCAEHQVDVGTPKDAFGIFAFDNVVYGYPREKLLPVLVPGSIPVVDLFLPSVMPGVVLQLYTEHFGYFLNTVTSKPSNADFKTCMEVFSKAAGCTKPREGHLDSRQNIGELRDLLLKAEEMTWSEVPFDQSSGMPPLHLAMNVIIDSLCRCVIRASPPPVTSAIMAVASASWLEGNWNVDMASQLMRPLFVYHDKKFSLFTGFMMNEKMNDMEHEDMSFYWTSDNISRYLYEKNRCELAHLFKGYGHLAAGPTHREQNAGSTGSFYTEAGEHTASVKGLSEKLSVCDHTVAAIQSLIWSTMRSASDVNNTVLGAASLAAIEKSKCKKIPCRDIIAQYTGFGHGNIKNMLSVGDNASKITACGPCYVTELINPHNKRRKYGKAPLLSIKDADTSRGFQYLTHMEQSGVTVCSKFLQAAIGEVALVDAVKNAGDKIVRKEGGGGNSSGKGDKVIVNTRIDMYGTWSRLNGVNLTALASYIGKEAVKTSGDLQLSVLLNTEFPPLCPLSVVLSLRQIVITGHASFQMSLARNIASILMSIKNQSGQADVMIKSFKSYAMNSYLSCYKELFVAPLITSLGTAVNSYMFVLGASKLSDVMRVKNKLVREGVVDASGACSIKNPSTVEELESSGMFVEHNEAIMRQHSFERVAEKVRNFGGPFSLMRNEIKSGKKLKLMKLTVVNSNDVAISMEQLLTSPNSVNMAPCFVLSALQTHVGTDVGTDVVYNTIKFDKVNDMYYIKMFPNNIWTKDYKTKSSGGKNRHAIASAPSSVNIAELANALTERSVGFIKEIPHSLINMMAPNLTAAEFTMLADALQDSVILDDAPLNHAKCVTIRDKRKREDADEEEDDEATTANLKKFASDNCTAGTGVEFVDIDAL